jgi:hypothetical protein
VLGNVTTYTLEAALAYSEGSHTFQVKAVDTAGNEGAAASLSFICDNTQPSISSVSAYVTSSSSVTVAWTTNEAASSQVEYGTTAAYGSSQPASPSVQSSYAVSHSINLTGLTANTTYHYRIRSIDSCGNENVSEDCTFTIDTIAPAISDVAASATTESGATITWTTDEASTSQVEYGTATSYGSISSVDTTPVQSHSVGLSGLSIATAYHFRVKSKDAAGNEAVSGDYSFTTPGTQVGGILSENTTWTKAGSPYLIADLVQIPLGVKLTIEPGVTITRRTSGYMFLVQGEVHAHGIEGEEITFDGGGNSSFFSAEGSTAEALVDLEHCVITNGLAFWSSGDYGRAHLILRHSELSSLSYWLLQYPGDDVYIEYNRFINCGGLEIRTMDSVLVYIRYNLFNGRHPTEYGYADFCIQSWVAYGTSQTIVQYNSFVNIAGVALSLRGGFPAAMTAIENYWETLDTAVIDAMIHDKKDDLTCAGYIAYLPILTVPHPDTPTP